MLRQIAAFALFAAASSFIAAEPVKYVRFDRDGAILYGVLEGETITILDGDLFKNPKPTSETVALGEVTLLAPCVPSKVIAVGLNYGSHLGTREAPKEPPLFAKLPTCIVGPMAPIVLPADATNAHFEAEMVLVIGKKGKNVPVEKAGEYIFGVTCGNDVSERGWQAGDLQWFRAKASDTFGPIGPYIVTGLNPDALKLEGALNGETVQSQNTSDLIHDSAAIVSFVSRYVTLMPGDVIFTGTPGATKALSGGDTFSVTLEGVGTLTNPVFRMPAADAAATSTPIDITAILPVLDTNGDGSIQKNEAPALLRNVFAMVDQNKDDAIDKTESAIIQEFVKGTTATGGGMSVDLLLQVLDGDGDRRITREEAPSLLLPFFAIVDRDSDGFIDEFEADLIRIGLASGMGL